MKRALIIEESDGYENAPVYIDYDVILRDISYGFKVDKWRGGPFTPGQILSIQTIKER